ncbi:DUF4406 domain-containing protein [Bradyrhizobium sp.]
MRIYLGNKMTGIPYFNAPWFDEAAATLRMLPVVEYVFNPAEHDRLLGLDPMLCPNGTHDEAVAQGLPAGKALADDWAWIAEFSDALVVGPQWRDSPGTISEVACHQALRKPVWEYGIFLGAWPSHRWMEKYKLPPLLEIGKLETAEPDSEDEDADDGLTCDC